ncbi:hypothetical protein EDB89DRAFT_885780 [Lactarius sanguifluus]|nr:hypothetical protein EDB89DRAFT_885780 [Lactarius sanguifluus]
MGRVFDNNHASEELNAGPSLPEILWNFSRYKGRGRITLEQNPHFYLHCPADESIYTPKFRRRPLQDSSGALEHNDTVYVLFNRPCSIFLDIHHQLRIFDNVWSLNGFLIFRDSSGVLEGEQLVRASSIRYNLRYCEQPVVHQDSESRSRLNHRYLRPIVTPTANPTLSGDFEDWTVLSRLASHPINMHVYRSRGSNGSTSSLDVVPPPPTSERPGYHVLYTTINRLNDPILLWIFSYFLLDQNTWNFQLGWRKLSHVCQSWRHLIYETAFNFDMHILCTNGTPIVDTIDHLPHFPLFVDYREDDNRSWKPVTIGGEDELGIYHALRLRERVRRIDLHLSPLILHKFLMLMDRPFPILERLSLSFTVDKNTTLTLPKTFLASNLRHLALLGIGLPKRLRLLSSTISLVTLVLTDIQASGYFRPRLLVARLQFLPLLEELSIGFSIPLPHSSAERELLSSKALALIWSAFSPRSGPHFWSES